MNWRTSDSAREYLAAVRELLLAHEVENSLIYGIVRDLATSDVPPPPGGVLGIVANQETPLAAVVRTPPWPLVISLCSPAAAAFAAEAVHRAGIEVPQLLAECDAATVFVERWTQLAGRIGRRTYGHRLHRLDRVEHRGTAVGSLRQAGIDDIPLVARWSRGFAEDIPGSLHGDIDEMARQRVQGGEVYLWCDPDPVAMAAWTRPTETGICVNLVYTPPAGRGRGYATSAVAALTQQLLDGGRAWCALFTDTANPTSNRIYRRVGYRPVADFDLITFASAV